MQSPEKYNVTNLLYTNLHFQDDQSLYVQTAHWQIKASCECTTILITWITFFKCNQRGAWRVIGCAPPLHSKDD